MRVIGYCRVSTGRQADSGAGLDAQEDAIRRECDARGWELIRVAIDPAVSASKRPEDRPELGPMLDALDRGEADGLMVAKVDRAARSTLDLLHMLQRAERRSWAFVALDVALDTSTPVGELVVTISGAIARWERRIIGQRTAEALAVRKAQGVRLGRPVTLSEDVRSRIIAMRTAGNSLRAIANTLNAEQVPTAQGGAMWHASSVRAVLSSLELDAASAA
jgi:DNA invertase Pin-like site-specific DNA recombinase